MAVSNRSGPWSVLLFFIIIIIIIVWLPIKQMCKGLSFTHYFLFSSLFFFVIPTIQSPQMPFEPMLQGPKHFNHFGLPLCK